MLTLKGRELTSLLDADELSTDAPKVDISNNLLTNLEGIEAWENNLKWLNASHNQIKSIKHLKQCAHLNVLNLGYNKLSSTKNLNKLKELNALILNNNELDCVDGLSSLKELNTLVVSSNKLASVDLAALKKLQKFSASHNQLKEFPSLQVQKDIKDLKLNDNKIEQIPDWFVPSCKRVKTLDLGNNGLNDLQAIECLCNLPYLENLNLRGNALCSVEDYHIKMKEMFPNLKILDFNKMSDLYFKAVENKAKQKSGNSKENSSNKLEKSKNVDSAIEKSKNVDSAIEKSKNVDNDIEESKTVDGTIENSKNVDSATKKKNVIMKSETSSDVPLDRGFKSSKLKPEVIMGECDIQEDVELNGTEDQKNKSTEKSHKKEKKKKRKKKRKLSVENTDEKDEQMSTKKKEKVSKHTNEDICEQNLSNTDENKESKTKKTEKKKNQSKEKSKKSGVVAIKKISRKKNHFDSATLLDDAISFGMGKSCAWS